MDTEANIEPGQNAGERSKPVLRPGSLNENHFKAGFLIDEEWMAGVQSDHSGHYTFIVAHMEGTLVERRHFGSFIQARDYLAALPRDWVFESTHTCDNEDCRVNEAGTCGIGGCGKGTG